MQKIEEKIKKIFRENGEKIVNVEENIPFGIETNDNYGRENIYKLRKWNPKEVYNHRDFLYFIN